MPVLISPTTRVRESFLDAMAEFQAEGRGHPDDHTMVGSEIRDFAATWHMPTVFEDFTRFLLAQSLEEAPRPAHFVPNTTLWWVDGQEYLGSISIRHRLTPFLLEVGGHIGYDVRPSARRRGHATAMLRAALPIARALGVDPVLITCDEANTASRLVIEHNGGVLEDQRGDKLRYWVPCP